MWGWSSNLTRDFSIFRGVRRFVKSSNNLTAMSKKQYHYQSRSAKRRKIANKPAKDGSNEEVLLADVRSLLARNNESRVSAGSKSDDAGTATGQPYSPPNQFTEIEVEISELSSTGDGLGFSSASNHVYVVPFTVPGDVVLAKIVNYIPQANYTLTDFVKVITSAPERDDNLVQCPYFSKCGGCQIQMLPYNLQLQHKKTIIEKAYRNFSVLTPDVIPDVGNTIGSPLQYKYRTKLTPHFDGPPGCMSRKAKRDHTTRKGFDSVPPIGYLLKGTRKTLDIEDCPIGTDILRKGLRSERERVAKDISNYTKGATILLRESTFRQPKPEESRLESKTQVADDDQEKSTGTQPSFSGAVPNADVGQDQSPKYIEEKTCITDSRAVSTEYVDDFVFRNTAGAFFQNNNSILPTFTHYIRDRIISSTPNDSRKPIKYLIDAYCGSGLFTITLSSLFSSSTGIDIAGASIVSARENALANNVSNASFITADASKLFEEVTYPAGETVVIIDPPRKGCDDAFLQQLLRFGPRRVIYVSCNVHTQARDVGVMVEGIQDCKYEIESLQGFDFFPQTGHVEGVAILDRLRKI